MGTDAGASDAPGTDGGTGGDDRTRVLFVGGLGRSGSTLLERLLGELPGTVALGEVVHMWERGLVHGERCGCGRPFRDCPFWGKVGEIAFGGWDGFDVEGFLALKHAVDRTRFIPRLARGELPDGLRSRVREYAGHYLQLYRAACEASGAAVAVDSSKHASLAFCLRWRPDLDLRVLHVVRDSRAVAYSWTKQVRRPEAEPGGDTGTEPGPGGGSAGGGSGAAPGAGTGGRTAAGDRTGSGGEVYMARWSPARTAVHWNAQNLAVERLARCGTPTELVRYEDFLRAPVATLARAARFAGLDAGDGALSFLSDEHAELSANHTAAGNPMRFQTGRVRLRRDDTWRTRFGPAQRHLVTAMTLPLLRRLGYLGDAPAASPAAPRGGRDE